MKHDRLELTLAATSLALSSFVLARALVGMADDLGSGPPLPDRQAERFEEANTGKAGPRMSIDTAIAALRLNGIAAH